MRYLIDSSAWIEYLEGSKTGEKVHKILEGNNEVFVLPLIIAEVISKIKRKSQNSDIAYESIIKNAKIFDVTPRIAKEAGLLHAERKPKNKSFSLADSIIIKSAGALNATILTKDTHFKSFKNVVLI